MHLTKRLFITVSLLIALVSFNASAVQIFIHVQGDSNTEGLLPGPLCGWNMALGAGNGAECPWPAVMEEALRANGLDVIVINHAESGRRLVGRILGDNVDSSALNGVGQKDGRVALQSIVMMMMNRGGEQNENNVLLINLGTNDLNDKDVTVAQLEGRLITHVVAIITNPLLQIKLLGRMNEADRADAERFLKQLNELMRRDIELGGTEERLPEQIIQNQDMIRRLFALINWRIVIIPPVLMTGHPFGGMYPNSEFARQWPEIVQRAVAFFGNPRIFAVENAQQFATPHTDEWGGQVHFVAEDHRDFGRGMADFLLRDARFANLFPQMAPPQVAHAEVEGEPANVAVRAALGFGANSILGGF